MPSHVVGVSRIVDVVLSLDTNIYASGDVLAATQVVDGAVRINNGTGVIQSILLQDDDDQAGALDLVFLDANTSIGTENAAVSMADNDNILGVVEIAAADYVDMANSQCVTKANVGIGIRAVVDTDDIYIAAVSRDTKTYTAAGITVRLFILQD